MHTRRAFLADVGMGFTGLALGRACWPATAWLAAAPEPEWTPPDGKPHFTPKAKRVIWLFMVGGTSHVEGFDPKPALNQYAGKTIAETPFKSTLESPYLGKNVREFVQGLHKVHPSIYPLQIGYTRQGECGTEISDWWPHVGACADDLAVVRSLFWTTDSVITVPNSSSTPAGIRLEAIHSRRLARGCITGSGR